MKQNTVKKEKKGEKEMKTVSECSASVLKFFGTSLFVLGIIFLLLGLLLVFIVFPVGIFFWS